GLSINKHNPKKQAELYTELLKSGNYQELIYRYETQPQLGDEYNRDEIAVKRLQHDEDLVKLYIQALFNEGESDRIATTISKLISEKKEYNFKPFSSDSGKLVKSAGTLYNLTTEKPQLATKLLLSKKGQQFQQQTTINDDQYQEKEPLQVQITEAWSWSKILRKFGTQTLVALIVVTGLSVLLEQQGVVKTGLSGGDVEPNTTLQTIKFKDVEGVDEAKNELEEVVEFLKEPKKFMAVGGKLPKGILLYGPPGTGKTHLARAIAGEAGVPFFQMSGSEFDEMYVGVGARRVRDLFAAARKKAPCIVFVDEIDAVGSKRSPRDQSYLRQTLNQLLVELDGFSASDGVVFIAATNQAEALDKALVRPGRLDRRVPVPLPDVRGRAKILNVHSKGITIGKDIDMNTIARGTPGFSGADLANLINHAAIKASREGSKFVRHKDMEWAKDKIIMGAERKSAVITEASKRMTAYHEGGHALVGLFTEGATPLHKVTVMPRGNALGVTIHLPKMDVNSITKKELLATLDVCMGGKVAEELVYGEDEVTSGIVNDLQQASSIAKSMVCRYGMGEKTGLVSYTDEAFDKISDTQRSLLDEEIKNILEHANQRAMKLLKSKRTELDRLALALIEYETLSAEDVELVIK
ncbi:hypothetical protein HK099_001412, partial [Clydaea vesicula]